MAIETHVFAYGSWRKAQDIYVNRNGSWVACKEVWTNQAGTWRKVFTKGYQLNIDVGDGALVGGVAPFPNNVDIRTIAINSGQWDEVSPVTANVTVYGILGSTRSPEYDWQDYLNRYSDVNSEAIAWSGNRTSHTPITYAKRHWMTIGQFDSSRYLTFVTGTDNSMASAFRTGGLPAGSVVNLTVTAGSSILGAGGIGGYGGVYTDHGGGTEYQYSTNGYPGGSAIYADDPLVITNNGMIASGGGGGAGGAGAGGGEAYDDPGGAGGGGAGSRAGPHGGVLFRTGTSYDGFDGTLTTGGDGGTLSNHGSKEWAGASPGGRGGDLGLAGTGSNSAGGGVGFFGGFAGLSVQGSRNVTWQVLGDIRGGYDNYVINGTTGTDTTKIYGSGGSTTTTGGGSTGGGGGTTGGDGVTFGGDVSLV